MFQVSECFGCEMGPKTKMGEAKNKKNVLGVGRLWGPIRDFLTHHKYDAKKTLLPILKTFTQKS